MTFLQANLHLPHRLPWETNCERFLVTGEDSVSVFVTLLVPTELGRSPQRQCFPGRPQDSTGRGWVEPSLHGEDGH